ncbi:MAG: tRNA pseudouridine(38-40) synthase TruA [Magnetococcales bacterium]|nr:tRNA pseudouridine(38-40) synthase TruA [Magnetococcales bacterium]
MRPKPDWADDPQETIVRYRLLVAYDGGAFAGWQYQPKLPTVQGALESALERLCKHPVTIMGAGRTDSGVHATGQLAHFQTNRPRPVKTFLKALNATTPRTMSVLDVQQVPAEYNARYTAFFREYHYRLSDAPVPCPLERNRLWHLGPERLDDGAMSEALKTLLGKHDFSAFRASSCQAKTPIKVMQKLELVRSGNELTITIGANAFLHHMVRNIVGSLVMVGQKRWPVEQMEAVLKGRDRELAGPTAPAHGLYLIKVLDGYSP